jgi:hypothetical protein
MLSAEVRELIDSGLALLIRERDFNNFAMEIRASALLTLVAKLGQISNELQHERIGALSLERASFGSCLSSSDGKNITEKKIMAETSASYRPHKTKLEELDADLTYLKTIMDVFMNGHIMWRQFAKTEN